MIVLILSLVTDVLMFFDMSGLNMLLTRYPWDVILFFGLWFLRFWFRR